MKTPRRKYYYEAGFTIVELLIVIVVIAILAAIVIIAYTGIQNKAHAAAAQAASNTAAKLLTNSYTVNGTYPTDLSTVYNGNPMPTTDGSTYSYHPGAGNTSYCMTVTNGNNSYKVTDTATQPTAGGCPGDGVGGVAAITNLATNPSAESVTTGWGYWSAGGAATFTRQTGGGYSGTSFMRMVFTAASTTGSGGMYYGNSPEAVQVGNTYSLSGYVRTSVSKPMRTCIEWYSSTPSSMGTSCSGNVTTTANSWTPLSATGQAPAGTAWARITFYASGPSWNIGETLDVDAVMMTAGSNLYTYADGNTPNWIWNGTTNNSTSTGPPQ
jgi:prepilin-type N-terminal cleavage/methylation domain-containing protein